jgi:hypothetical protein
MRAIVHAGMPKTGSSSIQAHFARAAHPGLERWDSEGFTSHMLPLLVAFGEPARLAQHRAIRARGQAFVDRLPRLRRRLLAGAEAQATRLAGSETRFFVSSERLTQIDDAGSVEPFARWIGARASEIRVIAYVRPPVSWGRSMLQQALKSGIVRPGGLRPVWAQYRERFERLDGAFGRDRVELVAFRPERFPGGDVVADFAARLGLEVAPGSAERANESLSLEAAAILFATHRARREAGERIVPHTAARAYVEAVRRLPGRPLVLAAALWAEPLRDQAADLAWIEDRLGEPLDEPLDPVPGEIASGGELMRVAAAALPALAPAIEERLADRPAAERDAGLAALRLTAEMLGRRAAARRRATPEPAGGG